MKSLIFCHSMKQRMLALLSSCAFCGSSWGRVQIFCKVCWKSLFRFSVVKRSSSYPFFVHRLLIWNEESSPYLQCLIYNLKLGGSFGAMEKISQELFLRFLEKDFWRKDTFQKCEYIFVPSPPQIDGKKDHAWFLAYFLKEKMKGKIEDLLLRKKGQKAQKSQDLFQRKKMEHLLKTPSWNPSHQKIYIFVDDVITTGATAEAAYKALKKPKNFLVWVIAERPLLKIKK